MMVNKYKKLLMEKQKVAQALGLDEGTKEKKYLRYFNPNKYLKSDNEVYVRVLPRKGDLFFIQFKKHSFKVGTAWKNAFCFYSRNGNGEIIGNECPFCDFLEENKNSLKKDTVYKLGAKNSHILLVYNYQADEVQKYEVNDYGITDILVAMQAGLDLDDETSNDVDIEGFDLYFKKGASGYAEVYKVEKPSITLSDIINRSGTFKKIPDLEAEVIPPFTEQVKKSVMSLFELAINVFEPTFASATRKENVEEDIMSNDTDEFDPNAIDDIGEFNIKDEIINTDDDIDDDVEDIKNFLRNRKK